MQAGIQEKEAEKGSTAIYLPDLLPRNKKQTRDSWDCAKQALRWTASKAEQQEAASRDIRGPLLAFYVLLRYGGEH